ncbi:MAG: sorbosone dehydrogenase family protein [Bdellovibrionales bacterium]|nr:sorbosone dehydrogenase family protein [Bdellovibrionales bacterium]
MAHRYLILNLLLLVTFATASSAQRLPVKRIKLPPGFGISVVTNDTPGARSLARSADGTLFVGTRREGVVYAVEDSDGDHRADRVSVIVRDLHLPNGVAVRDKDLYVAEIGRIIRYRDIDRWKTDTPSPEVIFDRLPAEEHHGWRYIAFGPDGMLYVSIGAPCNVCLRDDDPRFGSISRLQTDGSNFEIFARGIRNSVGFDWNPATDVLWFTDNGRDWLGDDRPPDELNRAPHAGMHFGFPFCHGGDISDPKFGAKTSCDEFVGPAIELGPHVAALGMKFYQGTMFPRTFRNRIFIAEHGSWNRTVPIGYRLSTVSLDGNNNAYNYETFASGWRTQADGTEGAPWGRPVDLLELPDGSLLVADDLAGAIYRVSFSANGEQQITPTATQQK